MIHSSSSAQSLVDSADTLRSLLLVHHQSTTTTTTTTNISESMRSDVHLINSLVFIAHSFAFTVLSSPSTSTSSSMMMSGEEENRKKRELMMIKEAVLFTAALQSVCCDVIRSQSHQLSLALSSSSSSSSSPSSSLPSVSSVNGNGSVVGPLCEKDVKEAGGMFKRFIKMWEDDIVSPSSLTQMWPRGGDDEESMKRRMKRNLIENFATEVIKAVESIGDITEKESQRLTQVIDDHLLPLVTGTDIITTTKSNEEEEEEEEMESSSSTSEMKKKQQQWMKMVKLRNVLEMPLVKIGEMWMGGELNEFGRDELCNLITALFTDTRLRFGVLNTIKQQHPGKQQQHHQ